MAASNDDIPPVPPAPATGPTAGGAVPPVEPPPAAVQPPAGRPDPYAAPVAPNPYAPSAYAPAPAGPPQGLSVTSMILGIGGLLLTLAALGFLPALAAVITGHIAQKRQPYAKPFWLTGIITGYVGVGISLVTGLFLLIGFLFLLPFSYS